MQVQGNTGIHTAKYLLLLFIAVALSACGARTDKPEPAQPGFSAAPGLGDSGAAPTGQAFTLPQGVSLATVVGALHPLDEAGNKILTQPQCGSYTSASVETLNLAFGFVDLCVELVNSASGAVSLTLPGGLTFISRDDRVQNGFLAQSVTVNVPTGSKWVLLRLYCLNQSYPGADGRQYLLGPQSDYAPLQEVVNILQSKSIDQSETWTVQRAIWHVTDNPAGLTEEVRAELNGL